MKSNPQPEQVFHGIPVSRGIAMGPISVMARGFSAPGVYPIAPGAVVSEQGRFDTAVRVTKEQLA
ncbi:hypothetical protein N9873_01500, partial [Akkermansiaceae bacterium]|nr:hypothetical protein [Akkermansiaceae bacterium]